MCFGYRLFFAGGLVYGVMVGALGLRAIGTSTYTIETIVDKEFEIALGKLENEVALCEQIKAIQLEEREHRDAGLALAGRDSRLNGFVANMAKAGAYAAKTMAASL